jgi:urea carboxylase
MRRDFISGRFQLKVEEGTFRLADYQAFLADNAAGIRAFKETQQASFEAERERWKASGQAEYISESAVMTATEEVDLPEGAKLVAAHVPGNIWKVQVAPGDAVKKGDVLVIIESMKMEFNVHAPCDGEVHAVLAAEGSQVGAGIDLVVLKEA